MSDDPPFQDEPIEPAPPKSKDDYQTEEERVAWQRGFDAVMQYKGPRDPIQDWLANVFGLGASISEIHPLTKELLEDAFTELPEQLHAAITAGYWFGWRAQLKPGAD